jgi:ubiquinone/menaquinone biosynthesis C-methylase UbiE
MALTINNHMVVESKARAFEPLYLALRTREGRLYSDEELVRLPDIAPAHQYANEWTVRKRSCTRLLCYLAKKEKPLSILEIGCGNGWLCHHLAGLPGSTVTGLDVNSTELEQAGRVFSDCSNLRFLLADPFSEALDAQRYDIIVLAAAVQYFSSLPKILDRCLKLLEPGGEVHLLDTHFYRPQEVLEARGRSERYFALVGCPEMLAFYHHHLLEDLRPYHYRLLHDPRSFVNRLFKNPHPFYWISVYK